MAVPTNVTYAPIAVGETLLIGLAAPPPPAPPPPPPPAATYTVTPPAQITGVVGVTSGAWTVIASNLQAGQTANITITRAPSGTLSTPGLALTAANPSGQVTLTPVDVAVHTLSFANDIGMANPAPFQYTASSAPDTAAPTGTGAIVVSSITSSSYTATHPLYSDPSAPVSYQWRVGAGGNWTTIAGNGRSVTRTGATPASTETIQMRSFDGVLPTPNYSAPLSAQVTLQAAAPPPPPAPAPQSAPVAGAYRFQQPYLFQTAPVEFEPNRMTVNVSSGTRFERRRYGPTGTGVSSQWFWEQSLGDYIDGAGTRYGNAPAFSAPINGGSETTYTPDCTAIVQQAQAGNRWLAMVWRSSSGSVRSIYGKNSANPPSIAVTYTDGSNATLACRITAANVSAQASAYPNFEAATYQLPMLVEFDRPSKPVQTATLTVRVAGQFSGNTNLQAFLLDPRVNAAAPQSGSAAAQPLDAGLVGDANVLVLHRYLDGANLADFVYTNPTLANLNAQAVYDPAIYGTGAQDLNKHPHVSAGKWTGLPTTQLTPPLSATSLPVDAELVTSSFTNYGFKPLAPGLGALRMRMHPVRDRNGNQIADGSWVGETGSGFISQIFLPASEFGVCEDLYVRQYMRIGTPSGGPWADSIATRYQVHQSGTTSNPSEIDWTSKGGKCFIVPDHHCYPDGGFSATAGGIQGWQARMGWGICDENEGGPAEGGWAFDFHAFDIQGNPSGNYARNYTYSTNAWLQSLGHGGMGVMYAHRWYCFEVRLKLNTVLPYYPGFTDDGVMTFWLDGKQIVSHENIVFRQRPIYRGLGNATHNTAQPSSQFSAAVVSGMASGEGYAGVTVRNNRSNSYYVAVVSRFSATQAVIGLAKRVPGKVRLTHLAMTDPIAWADGDELRLEATGTVPTVLTVKKNGTALTLKWFTGATQHPAPASTALQTATSYSDAASSSGGGTLSANQYIGLFACNNHATNGLRIDSWSGGEIGGTPITDAFAYSDADLNAASANWVNHDGIGPLIVRSGAVIADPVHRASQAATLLPARELGHRNLLFNWFHGGQTLNAEERILFVTGLAASKSYIGPMNVPLPAYVPAENNVSVLTVANGGLANNFISVAAPYYQQTQFWNTRNGDAGPVLNPYWGDFGGLVMFGAGHGSTNDNTVSVLEFGPTAAQFKRLTNPTPLFGTGTDETTKNNNSVGNAFTLRDPAWGEYTTDGQPCSAHTYGALDIIGPEHGGAANGTLMTVIRVAQAHVGDLDTLAAHRVRFPTATGAPGSYTWERVAKAASSNLTGQQPIPAWSQFVPAQQRIYYEARWQTALRTPRWFNLATGQYEVGTGTARVEGGADAPNGGRLVYVPQRDLMVYARSENGNQLTIRYMRVAASDTNPNWAGPATLSQALAVPRGFSAICWCADNGKLLMANITGNTDAVYEVTIPATLTDTWVVERVALPSGQTLPIPQQNQSIDSLGCPVYKGWDYNPKLRSVVYWPNAATTAPNNDTVYLYRPRGT